MSSVLPYDSLPGRSSPVRPALDVDHLSSPRSPHLLAPPSALPGYLLPPRQQEEREHRASSPLCSDASSLAPPPRAAPPAGVALPCCRSPGVALPLLRLGVLAFSVAFWAAGLAVFTLGVWARAWLADYLLLSANRYPRAPLLLLGTGAAVAAWGLLGCVGAAAGLPRLLRAYAVFQLAALACGLGAGLSGLFYRRDVAEGFHSGLLRAVAAYGQDGRRADALDGLQRALRCCGAEGWRDWLTSDWAGSVAAGNGSWAPLPDSCCAQRRGCRDRPPPGGSDAVHPHGCFWKVFSVVNDNVFHIAVAAMGLALAQIGGIALACLLASKLTRAHHRPVGAH